MPDEMSAAIDKQFNGCNANKDGYVTVEEILAIIPFSVATPKIEANKSSQPAK